MPTLAHTYMQQTKNANNQADQSKLFNGFTHYFFLILILNTDEHKKWVIIMLRVSRTKRYSPKKQIYSNYRDHFVVQVMQSICSVCVFGR